jgi:hypothetical protein
MQLLDLGPDFTLTGVALTLSTTVIVDIGVLNTDTIFHNSFRGHTLSRLQIPF